MTQNPPKAGSFGARWAEADRLAALAIRREGNKLVIDDPLVAVKYGLICSDIMLAELSLAVGAQKVDTPSKPYWTPERDKSWRLRSAALDKRAGLL